ncbi:Ribosomal protein S6 kinase delta-1 [Chamberlinius hualienensis]
MSRKVDPWVRRFEVNDPCLHQKGYTIYKITSTVFPRNSPEAATEVVVWRRFSEIKRLHKALRIVHQNLHLKGEFPSFPKDKLFGRFEPSVIEERRHSALQLLEFVALNPPLFTNQIFVKFFETGIQSSARNKEEKTDDDDGKLMVPIKLRNEHASVLNIEPAATTGECSILSGVWNYRQTADEISLDSNEESDDQDVPKDTVQIDLSYSRIGPAEIGVFDPFSPPQLEDSSVDSLSPGTGYESNAWLLSALVTCDEISGAQRLESSGLNFPQAFADYDEPDNFSTGVKSDHESLSNSQLNKTEANDDLRPIIRNKGTRYTSTNLFEGTKSVDQIYTRETTDILISAKQHEAKGDYQKAFDFYKTLIEKLLKGLKEELDPVTSVAVRRDISKYLSHAESIYEKHLKDLYTTGANTSSIYCSPSSSTSQSQLERYKVLGVVSKVLLVLDCATNSSYVIKVLAKSFRPHNINRSSIFPRHIINMVQLVRYHETEDSVFLVLQYATGGRLWNFVSSYLQSVSFEGDGTALEGECSSPLNVYAGRKLTDNSEDQLFENMTAREDKSMDSLKHVHLLGDSTTNENQRVSFSNKHDDSTKGDSICTNVNAQSNKVNVENGEKISFEDIWNNLKNVDTHQLLFNAQRLMENVDETLRVSNKIYNSCTAGCDLTKPNSPTIDQPISPPVSRGISRARRRSRHTSGGEPFAIERSNSVIRESSGSVELQRNRIRHFSSVFRQLDEMSSQMTSLPENYIRIWASEIVECIAALHKLGIICKDLKPDNILLNEKGHVLLTYFSQWSTVDDHIDQTVKDNFYTAPELCGISPVTPACDWWSVGALLFELFTGKTLISCHQGGFNSHAQLNIPNKISTEAESLLKGFLCYNANERLGSGPLGFENIKAHPFFKDVVWN